MPLLTAEVASPPYRGAPGAPCATRQTGTTPLAFWPETCHTTNMKNKNTMSNEISAETAQLLRELGVNTGGNYFAAGEEFSNIDDEWLNEFVEDYNF